MNSFTPDPSDTKNAFLNRVRHTPGQGVTRVKRQGLELREPAKLIWYFSRQQVVPETKVLQLRQLADFRGYRAGESVVRQPKIGQIDEVS